MICSRSHVKEDVRDGPRKSRKGAEVENATVPRYKKRVGNMVQVVIKQETYTALEPLDEDPDREPKAQADGEVRSSEVSLFMTHGVPLSPKRKQEF